MKSRIIIYISIFTFLTAVILSNMNETQDKEYTDDGTRQLEVGGQLEEAEATDLFLHLPVDW